MIKSHLKHGQLIDIKPDQHHKRLHDLNSKNDHSCQLDEKFIKYSNPPLHNHKQQYSIKVRKASEKIIDGEHLVFFNEGTIHVTDVFNDNKNDRIQVFLSSSCTTAPGPTPSGDGYQDYETYKNRGTAKIECWYSCGSPSSCADLVTKTQVANTLTYVPYISVLSGTLDKIAIITTSATAGHLTRIGLYSNTSDTNMKPASLIADFGTVDCSTAGVHSASISQDLEDNKLYWLAILTNATITFRVLNTTSVSTFVSYIMTNGDFVPFGYYTETYNFANNDLPASASPSSISTSNATTYVYAIFVRYSS